MEVNRLGQGGQEVFTPNLSAQNLNNSVKTENENIVSKVNITENGNKTKETQVSEEKVKKSVDKLNKLLEGRQTHVEYEPVGKAKHMGIKIIDNETKEVVQELPPRKIVEMIDKLCELAGIMIDERA